MISNLEYYKVFYFVAKYGSLTAAAGELNISQPAVSQSIKQLEQQLNVSLFFRIAKGVQLTKEGKILFEYVERGYNQIKLGEQKLGQMLNLEMGEIHIGASDMTLQFYLLPFLEQFHEKYPNIKVVVTNAPTPETLSFLEADKIDFGIVSTPFEESTKVKAVPVREIEDIFVAGHRFIAYKNRTLNLEELENLPLICLEKTTSTRACMDQFLADNKVEIHPEFELATSDMIVQFALRNLGIASVVSDFAKQYIEEGKLFELRFNKVIPKREFCVVYSEKSTISSAARELLYILGIHT